MIVTLALTLSALNGNVTLVTDEAEAVLAARLATRSRAAVPKSVWDALFATDGYRRLKDRELGMKRKFEDADFKAFVYHISDADEESFAQALDAWKRSSMEECQKRALAYLPKGADITAKVYLLIKPQTNSFVWDVQKDPAIMLYLDAKESKEAFTSTVAHEMHHIGYDHSCPSQEFSKWLDAQSDAKKTAYIWMGAFGEGFAVLAAADGIDKDPQAWAEKDVRDDWTKGMTHQPDQFREVESFFLKVLKGDLNKDQALDKAREFYGIVGPWYTVGYTMATTIERADGRGRLIECYRDPRLLLPTYNEAVKKFHSGSPTWSDEFLRSMGTPAHESRVAAAR
jgi:hypothetical protein